MWVAPQPVTMRLTPGYAAVLKGEEAFWAIKRLPTLTKQQFAQRLCGETGGNQTP